MTPLRQQMIRELQLQRKSPATIEAYVAAVAHLAQFYHRSPDQLAVEQVRQFIHHLIVERKLSRDTVNQKICGIQFFYRYVLRQAGWNGHENWGKTLLRGEQCDSTTIRLKDGSFTNAAKPEAIMWCGGFGSADWFHNYVENLTFDVGANNPGAIALQFYSNNSGAVRNCRFTAAEDSGVVGLDLAHRDMNGPLLVRNCEVLGFQTGIDAARSVNGQTFEPITLRGQRRVGFRNEGQPISLRGLRRDNAVPAVSYKDTTTDMTVAPGSNVQVTAKVVRAIRQGQLRGQVLTFKGEPLAATITVKGKTTATATAAADGYFTIELPEGSFSVEISADGFVTQKRTVGIKLDGVTVLNVDLRGTK